MSSYDFAAQGLELCGKSRPSGRPPTKPPKTKSYLGGKAPEALPPTRTNGVLDKQTALAGGLVGEV